MIAVTEKVLVSPSLFFVKFTYYFKIPGTNYFLKSVASRDLHSFCTNNIGHRLIDLDSMIVRA